MPFEIHVATIHDVKGSRFREQDVEDIGIVHFAVGNVGKSRNVATQIEQLQLFENIDLLNPEDLLFETAPKKMLDLGQSVVQKTVFNPPSLFL